MTVRELEVAIEALGERYEELRLVDPEAELQLQRSLEQYGQLSPLVVCQGQEGILDVVDGYKRLHAARRIAGLTQLRVRVLEFGERAAKAAMLCLNWVSRRTSDLEEAWVVRSMVREDGLSQVEVGVLLHRNKSWVCRRLSLVERLNDEVQSQLRLGLVKSTVGRELARLPRGNQERVLEAARRSKLGTREVAALVDLILKAPPREQAQILGEPLAALSAMRPSAPTGIEAHLSAAGSRLKRDLKSLVAVCRQVAVTVGLKELGDLDPAELVLLSGSLAQARRASRQATRVLEQAWAAVDEVRHVTAVDAGGIGARGSIAVAGRLVAAEDSPGFGREPQHGARDHREGGPAAPGGARPLGQEEPGAPAQHP